MNQRTVVQQQNTTASTFIQSPSNVLQRKCACGQHTVAGGECAECRKKREAMLQQASLNPFNYAQDRSSDFRPHPSQVPPIIHDVLRSPGQPLDPTTRAYMEPRFGQDFSRVRVHTDAQAAESARAVNALAYTVGRDVVFGAGQYALGTSKGRRLIAHELTHVVQQGAQSRLQSKLDIGPINDHYEQVADYVADHISRDVVFEFGQCVPEVGAGRHELAHIVQQKNLVRAIQRQPADEAECPGYRPDEVRVSHTEAGHLTSDVIRLAPDHLLIADFGVDWRHVKRSARNDLLLQSWLGTFESNDSYRLSIIGYSDCVGAERLNTDLRHGRAKGVEDLLGPRARSRVTFRGMAALGEYVTDNRGVEGRAKNRGVVINFHQEFTFPPEHISGTPEPIEIHGVACACDRATERYYDAQTFRFVRSIEPLITSIAGRRGLPTAAVAGAIADEYDTRRGMRGTVDDIQDALIDALPEFSIDTDRFFDIHSKLLNTLENDIGPANIKVRTALELVQRRELSVPGSPPSDIEVNRIVDFLLTEQGTVEATTAVIARAQRLFGPYLTEHGEELAETVLVEYFKQGESYFNRFSRAIAANPNHKICPGDGGCRFWHNRDRIQAALHLAL